MPYALALAAAAAFGAADFLGGVAARRAGAYQVALTAQAAGFAVLLPALLLEQSAPDRSALSWGMLAGLGGGAGTVLFFRGLARTAMSVVAPVTALVAAGLPVAAGALAGERPSALALAGMAAGAAAIAMTGSRAPSRSDALRGAGTALLAGAGFGLFFVFLAQAPEASGLWPLAGARMSSLAVLGGVLAWGRWEVPAGGVRPRLAVSSGLLDMAANVLFLLALRQGPLSLVAVLVSLYPAATVALSLAVLKERLRRLQVAAIPLALVAVALIAAGR
jgi:drug/metabolite transporter (DMT)-like permease